MAAMLMAGLDGIKRQIDPTTAGFGPINEDIFSWTLEQRSSIKRLPSSLEEALNALKEDHAFMLEGKVFSEDMITDWITNKTKEDHAVRTRPHPYEIEMYFDL
jgi:glutamine synthetase